jgi:hypothetical protein
MSAARAPAEKFPLVFEAAKRSLLVYERLRVRLMADLHSIEPMILARQSVTEKAADVLISAVAMVDFAYRYGQLVDALPLVNKKESAIRRLTGALGPVERARHHLQHMRGDLMTATAIEYPILGSIAWGAARQSFLLSFSHPGATQPGLIWDREEEKFVSCLEYTVKDAFIDFDAVYFAMKDAFDWLAALIDSPAPLAEYAWGEALGVSINVMKH